MASVRPQIRAPDIPVLAVAAGWLENTVRCAPIQGSL
jgi:hypothetical protein